LGEFSHCAYTQIKRTSENLGILFYKYKFEKKSKKLGKKTLNFLVYLGGTLSGGMESLCSRELGVLRSEI
jgi:hypothetical protein